jgi:hypothetical protein
MMDFGKFMQDEMGQALQVLSPEQRVDMNRLIQSCGKIMGNSKLTGKQKIAEVVLIEKEMQQKYADSSNR